MREVLIEHLASTRLSSLAAGLVGVASVVVGVYLLATSVAVYALMGAQYQGGANGKPYFQGRTAARLEMANGSYAIVATSGERYGPGF